jgi:hypothetical protein
MLQNQDNDSAVNYTFNRIHKRFMVLYESNDMRYVWKKVASEWKKYKGEKLPKRFKKYPDIWIELNNWIEERIEKIVKNGGIDVEYLNKSDLNLRGWDNKILEVLYSIPDKKVYLGRGRYAYYYNASTVSQLEDSDEFIEYVAMKLERKRKRNRPKGLPGYSFGTEFIKD